MKTTVLDTTWMGRPRSIAAVLLESDGHRAILDPGPASTLPTLRQLLDSRGIGVSDLNAILLTHIHLDHAGAAGALIRGNPNLEVYVHKAGVLHMADSTKRLALAWRIAASIWRDIACPLWKFAHAARRGDALARKPQSRSGSYAGARFASC